MATEPKVSILITARDLATKVVDGVKAKLSSFGASVKSVFSGINGVLAGLGIGLTGAALGKFFSTAVTEAAGAERAQLNLRDALQRVGLSYDALAPKVDAYVAAQAQAAALDDDDVANALSTLIVRSKNYQGSLDNLSTTLGLAAKEHLELTVAADIVGRAMTGNTRGLKALGITATDAQGAVGQLRAQYDGFAAKAAATWVGVQRRLNVAWLDLLEAFGRVITRSPAVRQAMDDLTATAKGAKGRVGELSREVDVFIARLRVGLAFYRAMGTVVVGGATVLAGSLVGILARVGLYANEAILFAMRAVDKFGALIGRLPGVGATIGFRLDLSGAEAEVAKFRAGVEKTDAAVEQSAFTIRENFERLGDAQLQLRLAERRRGLPVPEPAGAAGGGNGGGGGDDGGGGGAGSEKNDADKSRAREISTLTQLVALRKIDAAGLQRLYELQRLIAAEAQAESDRVKAGIGDRERLLALLKQQADITGAIGTAPTVTSGPSAMPAPAAKIKLSKSETAGLSVPTPDDALPEWLKRVQDGWYGVAAAEREARDGAVTFGASLATVGGGAIKAFADASQEAFAQIGQGSQAMGRAFGAAIRSGVAQAAKAEGAFYFNKGVAALGTAFLGGPLAGAALAASAKYFLASAGFYALGGLAGGGSGGGGGGGGGVARDGADGLAGEGRGKLILYMPDGASVFDPNDPRMVELWANMLGQITDREVVLTPGSRPR